MGDELAAEDVNCAADDGGEGVDVADVVVFAVAAAVDGAAVVVVVIDVAVVAAVAAMSDEHDVVVADRGDYDAHCDHAAEDDYWDGDDDELYAIVVAVVGVAA